MPGHPLEERIGILEIGGFCYDQIPDAELKVGAY